MMTFLENGSLLSLSALLNYPKGKIDTKPTKQGKEEEGH